jgi:hypothetical protein
MRSHYKRLLAAGGAITTAGAMAVSGITAASAASHGVSGTEHLRLMTTSATSNRVTFIGTGVFTTGGTDFASSGTNGTDLVKVVGGTFKIKHRNGHIKQTFDPRTCLMSISGPGTYKISGGTGKYAGIRGSGKFVLSIMAIAARDSQGKCSMAKAPIVFQQIITAQGPVSLP